MRERKAFALSSKFKTEAGFCDYVHHVLMGEFDNVEREYALPNSTEVNPRRCDLYVVDGLFKYVIEAKLTNRTSRVDQCIGQALVRAVALEAIAVCMFPSDIGVDATAMQKANALGVLMATEETIVETIKNNETRIGIRKRAQSEYVQPNWASEPAYVEAKEMGRIEKADIPVMLASGYSVRAIAMAAGVKKELVEKMALAGNGSLCQS